jgi:hypothetical protein
MNAIATKSRTDGFEKSSLVLPQAARSSSPHTNEGTVSGKASAATSSPSATQSKGRLRNCESSHEARVLE